MSGYLREPAWQDPNDCGGQSRIYLVFTWMGQPCQPADMPQREQLSEQTCPPPSWNGNEDWQT
eukprot:2127976-Amphidinium_carterae.1